MKVLMHFSELFHSSAFILKNLCGALGQISHQHCMQNSCNVSLLWSGRFFPFWNRSFVQTEILQMWTLNSTWNYISML